MNLRWFSFALLVSGCPSPEKALNEPKFSDLIVLEGVALKRWTGQEETLSGTASVARANHEGQMMTEDVNLTWTSSHAERREISAAKMRFRAEEGALYFFGGAEVMGADFKVVAESILYQAKERKATTSSAAKVLGKNFSSHTDGRVHWDFATERARIEGPLTLDLQE